MGPLHGLDYGALALFAGAALLAASGAVFVAGYLPRAQAPAAARGAAGAALVWGALACVLALVVLLIPAASRLPPAVAVVTAGLAILAAPFVVQPMPAAWRGSRAGLALLAAACLAVILSIL